jgi:cell wall-associated NlpC family hydrolase
MFDPTRMPSSGATASADLQPARPVSIDVAPLSDSLTHKILDATLTPLVRGSASSSVAINGTFDARHMAAAKLTGAIDQLQAQRKLSATDAALLKRIAADPAIGEQRLRLITEGIGHLGKPYNWGSTGPKQFDCSGLAGYVYRTSLGVNLPRTSYYQHRTGTTVNRQDLKAGDLVFFGGSRVTHVAIYLGDGMMLEAGGEGRVRSDKGSVRIRPLRGDYKGARRFIDDNANATTLTKPSFGERMSRMLFDWQSAQSVLSWLKS